MQAMRTHRWCGALVLVIALWWAAPTPVHAAPFTAAVEYASSQILFDNRPFTLGYQFSTSVPFNVNALAYWDDGLSQNHQVGLWDSVGTLLVSTTVLNTDPIQGHFQWDSIPIFTLGPGTYTIGGEFLGGAGSFPSNAVGVVTVPGFTWIKDEQQFGAGLNYPTVTTNGYGQNGILVPNFSIGSAVPESSTVLLLTAGLASILGYGWRRKRVA